jgi:hypothetical protein
MKKKIFALIALPLFFFSLHPDSVDAANRTKQLHFAKGMSSTTIRSQIRGYDSVDYQISARKGQTMSVSLQTSNLSNYFNITAPGATEALFIGSSSGSRYRGRVPGDGVYTISVYLMRNAARRDERAYYKLRIDVTGKGER